MTSRDYLQRFLFENLPIRCGFRKSTRPGEPYWSAELIAQPAELLQLDPPILVPQLFDEDCEFCGHRHAFDPIEIAGLFAATALDASTTRH